MSAKCYPVIIKQLILPILSLLTIHLHTTVKVYIN